jgi:hypothetical protein
VSDSKLETMRHSRRVDELLLQLITGLQGRMTKHDISKMEHPEVSIFNEHSANLQKITYGSPEYTHSLSRLRGALTHHYKVNRHHPEHFPNGVNDMTMVDLLEMLADWKAATEQHEDGDLNVSLQIQQKRFQLSDQLVGIFRNTAVDLGWIPKP